MILEDIHIDTFTSIPRTGKFRLWHFPVLKDSNIFRLWRFPVLKDSDIFRFWRFPVLKDSDIFRFWRFPVLKNSNIFRLSADVFRFIVRDVRRWSSLFQVCDEQSEHQRTSGGQLPGGGGDDRGRGRRRRKTGLQRIRSTHTKEALTSKCLSILTIYSYKWVPARQFFFQPSSCIARV